MKYAYSILLGEYLPAKECDYSDCKGFQIICAGTCKEPVFKVLRKPQINEVHYFSHYKEKDSDPLYKECELRVKSLSKHIMEQTASSARGQRLELFMRVFQNEIWKANYPNKDDQLKVESTTFRQIIRTGSLNDFMAAYRNFHYENNLSYSDMMEFIDEYLEDWRESGGGQFPTEFHLNTQRRIVWDLYEHLLSKPAKPNLTFLTRFAFLFLAHRCAKGLLDIPVSKGELEGANKLHFIVGEILNDRWNLKYFQDPEFHGMQIKFAAEILHESIGILLRVDWIKVLEYHRKQKSAAQK